MLAALHLQKYLVPILYTNPISSVPVISLSSAAKPSLAVLRTTWECTARAASPGDHITSTPLCRSPSRAYPDSDGTCTYPGPHPARRSRAVRLRVAYGVDAEPRAGAQTGAGHALCGNLATRCAGTWPRAVRELGRAFSFCQGQGRPGAWRRDASFTLLRDVLPRSDGRLRGDCAPDGGIRNGVRLIQRGVSRFSVTRATVSAE
ncbi:hypothetical protein AcW1_004065 [Taiwanofungus camphoratus]|nr:hypothetical protein AcW1_004065 [Antrodia cinnamomea]